MRALFWVLIAAFSVAIAAPSVAKEECYWTKCGGKCKPSYKFRNKQPLECIGSWKSYCCAAQVPLSELARRKPKQKEADEAVACRGKCGKKANGGPYFKCMDKCLGRKR
jgi:hypothetical protein